MARRRGPHLLCHPISASVRSRRHDAGVTGTRRRWKHARPGAKQPAPAPISWSQNALYEHLVCALCRDSLSWFCGEKRPVRHCKAGTQALDDALPSVRTAAQKAIL